jgi:hypothetical protein
LLHIFTGATLYDMMNGGYERRAVEDIRGVGKSSYGASGCDTMAWMLIQGQAGCLCRCEASVKLLADGREVGGQLPL